MPVIDKNNLVIGIVKTSAILGNFEELPQTLKVGDIEYGAIYEISCDATIQDACKKIIE